ncbi:ABC transporter permease [Homoserinibacter sp. YIM 151385]|uniref:ABC transporter permease n=1 Tax=Homoserinibacter sp. YIM 151385 TaxID=2985506 RepID=UPI0022F14583|nr:ABC transporter permease [Homoserinibacter sp. YIM 151385]WBU38171.1 ABC transporter permease [Homoserinibacter sp. YIM 151385]
MVAELLGLRLRVIANTLRGSRRDVGSRAIAILAAIAAPLLAIALLRGLAGRPDGALEDATLILATWTPVLALLVPVLRRAPDPAHPRAFIPFGLRAPAVALVLLGYAVLSLPSLVLGIAAVGLVDAWSRAGAPPAAALASAVSIYLVGLLLAVIGRVIGGSSSRGLGTRVARVVAVLVLVLLAIRLLPVLVGDPRYAFGRLAELAASLDGTPVAVLAQHPVLARDGLGGADAGILLGGVLAAAVLWGAWMLWIAVAMRGSVVRRRIGIDLSAGWFRILGGGPTGAVAARSVTYWLRDPRYAGSFAFLPLLPFLIVGVGLVGGVPISTTALVALPLMVLVLAWATLHNDVAHDSSAIWLHVVSGTSGLADRLGRLVPPLVIGIVMIAIGAPLTAAIVGDSRLVPVVAGVSAALLLGAIGISSAVSARFPYPAPRPGDSAFDAPQASTGSPGGTQALTFLGAMVVAVPALWAGWQALTTPEVDRWSWSGLGLGIGAGVLVAAAGIALGARAFERRGPELLAASLQS